MTINLALFWAMKWLTQYLATGYMIHAVTCMMTAAFWTFWSFYFFITYPIQIPYISIQIPYISHTHPYISIHIHIIAFDHFSHFITCFFIRICFALHNKQFNVFVCMYLYVFVCMYLFVCILMYLFSLFAGRASQFVAFYRLLCDNCKSCWISAVISSWYQGLKFWNLFHFRLWALYGRSFPPISCQASQLFWWIKLSM